MNAKEFVDIARNNYPQLPDAKTLAFLESSAEFIWAVCEELNKTVSTADRELIRYITKLYIKFYKEPNRLDYDWNDPFRMCGLLLYKIGNVEDSVLLWQVKELDFDTAASLEVQMLTGAGVDETITYLKSLDDEFYLNGAELIEANREDFPEDFVDVWETYFGYRTAG